MPWGREGEIGTTDGSDPVHSAAMIWTMGRNFRLLQRLFVQIERILQINDLHLIKKEVIEAAREGLIIGMV